MKMGKKRRRRAPSERPEPEKQALEAGSGSFPGEKEHKPNEALGGLPVTIGLVLLILVILYMGFFGVWALYQLYQMNHDSMERFQPDSSFTDFIETRGN